jgi:hypothetical protein
MVLMVFSLSGRHLEISYRKAGAAHARYLSIQLQWKQFLQIHCRIRPTPAKAPPLRIVHVPRCPPDLSLLTRVKAFSLLYVEEGGTSSF